MSHMHAFLATEYELLPVYACDLSIERLSKSESDSDTGVVVLRESEDFVKKLLHVVFGTLISMRYVF